MGLTGEIRASAFLESRIKEAEKMGFEKAIVPAANMKKLGSFEKIKICPFDNIKDVISRYV